jgi:hypothetical protein
MSFFKSRISRLEARQRRQHPAELAHFTSGVQVPPAITEADWHDWLAEQPCACGAIGCPERRIGLLVPTRCQTADEWVERYQHYRDRRREAFPEAELTVILTRGAGDA